MKEPWRIMPRLPPSTTRTLLRTNPSLLPIYRTTRDLAAARNELRWMQEHIDEHYIPRDSVAQSAKNVFGRDAYREARPILNQVRRSKLQELLKQRGRGAPLQYLLKSEYFGELELECRRGVLIPRQDTATITTALADRLLKNFNALPKRFRVLDLCSGSGCISLLLHHLLAKNASSSPSKSPYHRESNTTQFRLTTLGIDTSRTAITLARQNARKVPSLPRSKGSAMFRLGDVLRWNDDDIDNYGPQASSRAIVRTKRPGLDEAAPSLSTVLAWHSRTRPADPYGLPSALGSSSQRRRARQGFNVDAWSELDGVLEEPVVRWDVVVANPPYIAPSVYQSKATELSVRKFEPRLALVPSAEAHALVASSMGDGKEAELKREDTFYVSILRAALRVGAKVVMLEVGGLDQAKRVVGFAADMKAWTGVEIWRDNVAFTSGMYGSEAGEDGEWIECHGLDLRIRGPGDGNGRAVVCWREEGERWMSDLYRKVPL